MSVDKAKLKAIKLHRKQPVPEPLWKGPEEEGISFSLLNRFLACRERFRLLVVKGLKPVDTFNHRLEYGNMWHVCEESHAAGIDPLYREPVYNGSGELTHGTLLAYCKGLSERYRTQQEQIDHWYNVCKAQWPVYLRYWSTKEAQLPLRSILQEQVFRIPYTLPDGRVVRLKGKFDAVHVENKLSVLLQENKTKGDIKEAQLVRQLTFDLQTMVYLTALHEINKQTPAVLKEKGYGIPGAGVEAFEAIASRPIAGVLYNVVRRPLSGGKGTIVRHKPSKSNPQGESKTDYYKRVAAYIEEEPSSYFMRWRVIVTKSDVDRFKRECLDPILTQLCDWWEWIKSSPDEPFGSQHWRTPYGIYNPTVEGFEADLDEYMDTGNMTGLHQTDNLFPELE